MVGEEGKRRKREGKGERENKKWKEMGEGVKGGEGGRALMLNSMIAVLICCIRVKSMSCGVGYC